MSSFRVLIRKTAFCSKQTKTITLVNYMDELNKAVLNFNGFINSENYWISEKKYINNSLINVCTISNWENSLAWDTWFNSTIRNNIENKYNGIIKSQNVYDLYVNNSETDYFLL